VLILPFWMPIQDDVAHIHMKNPRGSRRLLIRATEPSLQLAWFAGIGETPE
jgi:hypothetical protein